MYEATFIAELFRIEKQGAAGIFRDNPILNRLIEVGTKAPRRGLMSGETLRAPRQQLRRLHASAFVLLPKPPTIARLFGAHRVFAVSFGPLPGHHAFSLFRLIRKSVGVIRKNFDRANRLCRAVYGSRLAAFCFYKEKRFA